MLVLGLVGRLAHLSASSRHATREGRPGRQSHSVGVEVAEDEHAGAADAAGVGVIAGASSGPVPKPTSAPPALECRAEPKAAVLTVLVPAVARMAVGVATSAVPRLILVRAGKPFAPAVCPTTLSSTARHERTLSVGQCGSAARNCEQPEMLSLRSSGHCDEHACERTRVSSPRTLDSTAPMSGARESLSLRCWGQLGARLCLARLRAHLGACVLQRLVGQLEAASE